MCYTGWGWQRESQQRHCLAQGEREVHGAREGGGDAREQIQCEPARDDAGRSVWQGPGLGWSEDRNGIAERGRDGKGDKG